MEGVKEHAAPIPHETLIIDTNVAVMTTNAVSTEERIADLENKLALLTKALEEKDQQITSLKGKVTMQIDLESSKEQPYPTGSTQQNTNNTSIGYKSPVEPMHGMQSASVASLSVQQL